MCVVHCALTPILLGVLPAASALAPPRIERALFATTGAIGLLSLAVLGPRRHGRLLPFGVFMAGFALLYVARHAFPTSPIDAWVLMCASVVLVVEAYRANRRLSHSEEIACST